MFSRLYLEITTCCNRACSFCPGTARPAAFVTPETFRTLAAKLRPYGPAGPIHTGSAARTAPPSDCGT